MSDKLERLKRMTHSVLGEGVVVKVRLWDGQKGKEFWETHFFPKNQGKLALHPGHPSGYNPDSSVVELTACVSPTASWFGDFKTYAQFRWS